MLYMIDPSDKELCFSKPKKADQTNLWGAVTV
jgi:hypothetical protein